MYLTAAELKCSKCGRVTSHEILTETLEDAVEASCDVRKRLLLAAPGQGYLCSCGGDMALMSQGPCRQVCTVDGPGPSDKEKSQHTEA